MFYNATVKTENDEFRLDELIYQLWLYRKNLDYHTPSEHVTRRLNFVQKIDEWADKKGWQNKSIEYTIIEYLEENYPTKITKGGYK